MFVGSTHQINNHKCLNIYNLSESKVSRIQSIPLNQKKLQNNLYSSTLYINWYLWKKPSNKQIDIQKKIHYKNNHAYQLAVLRVTITLKVRYLLFRYCLCVWYTFIFDSFGASQAVYRNLWYIESPLRKEICLLLG